MNRPEKIPPDSYTRIQPPDNGHSRDSRPRFLPRRPNRPHSWSEGNHDTRKASPAWLSPPLIDRPGFFADHNNRYYFCRFCRNLHIDCSAPLLHHPGVGAANRIRFGSADEHSLRFQELVVVSSGCRPGKPRALQKYQALYRYIVCIEP